MKFSLRAGSAPARVLSVLAAAVLSTIFCTHICSAERSGPDISAKGAIVISAETGDVLFAANADKKLPMASTTKIMTTILAIEHNEYNLSQILPETPEGKTHASKDEFKGPGKVEASLGPSVDRPSAVYDEFLIFLCENGVCEHGASLNAGLAQNVRLCRNFFKSKFRKNVKNIRKLS